MIVPFVGIGGIVELSSELTPAFRKVRFAQSLNIV